MSAASIMYLKYNEKDTLRYPLFVYINFEDSNSERARRVKKTVRWTVFSESGAQSGTVSYAHGRQAGWMRSMHISDGSP